MSLKAMQTSSSQTFEAGIAPDTILQNKQFSSITTKIY
jgi:hypothetical protein